VQGLAFDQPLAVDDGAALSYFHADVLGSINKITSTTGAITLTRQYDAWGNLEIGASAPGVAFTGREWDPETGLYYYRARDYDPKLGRFLNEDPIGFGGGSNFYAYVDGEPFGSMDPSGLASVKLTKPNVTKVPPPLFPCTTPVSQWGCVTPAIRMSATCTDCGVLKIKITITPNIRVRRGKK